MLRSDIPQVLFSSIREDNPYRASKVFQIERWCYAHWGLHKRNGQRVHNFLAQVLSSEGCWKKVGGLHGVRLDRQVVGKKLIAPGLDNPLGTEDRYDIACRCCLEEDIVALFESYKRKRNVEDGDTDSLKKLVSNLSGDPLVTFWSHFIGGYVSKLNLNGRHPYEYGLKCAMDLKKAEAVEFFWNKIKSLPEDELSAQQKDEVFMKTAVRAAGSRCNSYPEIFEFCFSQISPDKYPELLKRDLAENRYYGSLSALRGMRCFDHVQTLFDCLKPSDISEDDYHLWLKCIETEDCSVHHANEGMKLFMHMWMREGFDSHRAFVMSEEVIDKSPYFHKNLLISLVKRGYMEPVWAVLDKASPEQIKEFMNSKQANHIRSILKERGDEGSLDKFLLYGKSVDRELENLSTDLTDVKLSKAHSLSKR